jgi:molybdopterin-guanine dinucleotide biosynthesis protein A
MSGTLGALLAGGRASRLGGRKTTVPLAGRPLLEHPRAALRPVVDEVVVVAKRDTVLPALGREVPLWVEPDEPRHPLTGIVHALRLARGRPVLVCAGDMPLVTKEVFERLLAAPPGAALAVVPRAGRRLQPVCALYLPAALPALAGFDRDARTTDVVEALGIEEVDFGEGECFLSVNTPGDLQRAEAMLRDRRRCGPAGRAAGAT